MNSILVVTCKNLYNKPFRFQNSFYCRFKNVLTDKKITIIVSAFCFNHPYKVEMSSALEIGNINYVFNIPKLKVSAVEAEKDCENNGLILATFDEEDQLPKISHQVSMWLELHFRGIYEVWHVRCNGQYGFISKDLSRKSMNYFFVNGENIKVVTMMLPCTSITAIQSLWSSVITFV